MDYSTYVATMRNLLVISEAGSGNAAFLQILPSMIDYAEKRIQSDLDLLAYYTSVTSTTTAGNRNITIPTQMDIIDSVYVVVPAGETPDAGTRQPLQRMAVDMLNYVWPQASEDGVPQWIALLNTESAFLAPTPDDAYAVEWVGLALPGALSETNTETYISTSLSELFIAASMVFGTGWQRDFGAQSDNPQAGVSWEAQYQALLQSEMVQEQRRKAQSVSWTSDQPSPLARQSKT